jgi:hypothetical protein
MIKVKPNMNNITFLDLETGDLIVVPRPIVLYNVIKKGKIHGFGKSVDGKITVAIYMDEGNKPIPMLHYYRFVSQNVYDKVMNGSGVEDFIELALEGAYPSYVESIEPYCL